MTVENVMQNLKLSLDLLASNIEAKKKRKIELRELVAEDARLNKEIGALKKEYRTIKTRLDWLIELFKQQNGGQFPDSLFPLFAQNHNNEGTESKKVTAIFAGYQSLWSKNSTEEHIAMYEVTGLEGYSRPTTLLEPTLRKKGIAIPPHPDYDQWKKYRGTAHAAEAH